MFNHFRYLIVIILITSCAGVENQRVSSNDPIISEKYQNADSLHLKLLYTEFFNSCLGLNVGVIQLTKENDQFVFTHIPTDKDLDPLIFKGYDKNLMNLIIDFETKAKNSNKTPNNEITDTTYNVKLSINGDRTDFSFCKCHYNGIEELIFDMKKLEIKN